MKTLLLAFLLVTTPAVAQDRLDNADELIDKITTREKALLERLSTYVPIAETYLQVLGPDGEGQFRVVRDHYFLSQARVGTQVDELPFRGTDKTNRIGHYAHWVVSVNMEYEPAGFIQMSHPMMDNFDREHYDFRFSQQESLNGIDCLVFNVSPKTKIRYFRTTGMYEGLVWVEKKDYTIVRYKGGFRGGNDLIGHYFHFDSMRVNSGDGLWVPATVYIEETKYAYNNVFILPLGHLTFKAQTRFWGYAPSRLEENRRGRTEANVPRTEHLTRPISAHILSSDAREEDNVVNQLENLSLLAPRGATDELLEAIVNNLELGSGLHIVPAVRCRELLTTRMEFFAVGHTIVVSRGLLDVMPDEATVAAILALGLARINLDFPNDKSYLNKEVRDPADVFRVFKFVSPSRARKQMREMAESYFVRSKYGAVSSAVGQFFRELVDKGPTVRQLFTANLGDSPWDHVLFADSTLGSPNGLSLHSALPLGRRTKIDPWNDQLTIDLDDRSLNGPAFEVIPLFPANREQKIASGNLSSSSPRSVPVN